MAISVYKTFSSGEVLTASDLNASFTQIVNNGTSVAFPATANISVGGYTLWFDASNTMGATSSAKGVNLAGMSFNDAKTTVASATAPDIWTATGKLIDYTGTTTATSFAAAPQAGAQRLLLCAAAAPFTAGANMLIDGYQSGATFTAAAGDVVDVIAVTTTQFRLKPRRYTPIIDPAICDFRLSLTSQPVSTTDTTAAETVFLIGYKGNRIALYDGANWNIRSIASASIDVPDVTGVHDVFCYDNAGTPTLEVLVWTNDTTRATALARQNGVLVKNGDATRRYLGTFYSTTAGNGQTEDSYANRYLWNYYNRVRRPMRCATETTNTWDYTTATFRQANASTANQLNFVVGFDEDAVTAEVQGFAKNTSANVDVIVGIGLDATNALATGCLAYSGVTQVANQYVGVHAQLKTLPGVGKHYLSWIELSGATGTTTWGGDGNAPTSSQAGIHGEIWA